MTTFNQLAINTTAKGSDQIPIYDTVNGDARRVSVTAVAAYVAQNLEAGSSITLSYPLLLEGVLVADLPAASVALAGARATVTDCAGALPANVGQVITGGGANTVPAFCDGSAWRIL